MKIFKFLQGLVGFGNLRFAEIKSCPSASPASEQSGDFIDFMPKMTWRNYKSFGIRVTPPPPYWEKIPKKCLFLLCPLRGLCKAPPPDTPFPKACGIFNWFFWTFLALFILFSTPLKSYTPALPPSKRRLQKSVILVGLVYYEERPPAVVQVIVQRKKQKNREISTRPASKRARKAPARLLD